MAPYAYIPPKGIASPCDEEWHQPGVVEADSRLLHAGRWG